MEKTKFKIYSLLLVKNEADIITTSLLDACRWSDKIIVIDNGSEDGTWEILKNLAKTHKQIIPFERYTGSFHIGLRARAFHRFKHEMKRGDWWCVRLDADEFFTGDVRSMLATVPCYYNNVKKQSTDYVLTKEDIESNSFTGDFLKDKPLITHSLPHQRRERRFVRHSPWLIWNDSWRYPHLLGLTAKRAIPVEHYQYRSAEQMQRRFLTRQRAKADGCGSFKHEKGEQWQDYLMSNEQLEEQYILSQIEELFEQSKVVLRMGRNTVKVVADKFVVKQFHKPRFPNSLIYGLLRKSKAERSYMYAKRLGQITPEPIMYIEHKRFGLLRESYYVSRLSALPYTFRQLEKRADFPNRQQHIDALARFTAHLHNQGILHRDYSGGNILFDDDDNIQLIDLNRLRFKKHISLREGCKNLNRLLLTDEDRKRFIEIYIEGRIV